jgi:S1-C subfamily serine protease
MQSQWLFLTGWLVACGGSSPIIAAAPAPKQKIAPQMPVTPQRPNNTLYRDEVQSAKRAGLGHFFALVDLEPKGELDNQGRMDTFQGFQIVALRPAREWLAFDFAPGDILTHINGVSVEHYSTWFEQFELLPKAAQVRVDLIRDGKPNTIVVRIVDRGANNARAPEPYPAAQITRTPLTPSVDKKSKQ